MFLPFLYELRRRGVPELDAAVVLTVLKTRYAPRWKARTLSTGSPPAPSRHLQRGVLPPGIRPFQERSVFCFRLDDGMRYPRHLSGKCDHRLAPAIGIIRMAGNIAAELVAEAVIVLARGDLRRHRQTKLKD